MTKPVHIDLFSGIGGFSLAADTVWGEMEHVFCEVDPFCQAILKKHWPEAKIYGDIRTLTSDSYSARLQGSEKARDDGKDWKESHDERPRIRVDLLTGGFPCQPFSQAGRRRGTEDDRYLWPEMLRVIREFHPRWVVGENVSGLATWNDGMVLEQVHADLEGEGYEVQAFVIPAVAVNSPHRRDRIWIVARYTEHDGLDGSKDGQGGTARDDSDTAGEDEVQQPERPNRQRDFPESWNQNWSEVAAALCRVDDGIPRRLDRTPRLKALGNSIVPQVAAEIFKAIKYAEEASKKEAHQGSGPAVLPSRSPEVR